MTRNRVSRSVPFFAAVGGLAVACAGATANEPASLDGTWDVVSYGDAALSPSSLTVKDGKLSGVVLFAYATPMGCGRSLEFSIAGDTLAGSSTPTPGCRGAVATITGTRIARQEDSETPWNGTWSIQGEKTSGELVISGLSASAGSNFKLTVSDGIASSTGPSRFTFAARKR